MEKYILLSEKVSYRLKRIYVGIAMGIAISLLYTSYLVLANAIGASTSIRSIGFVLTPIEPIQK